MRPHRTFTRKGDDIHIELPISLRDAVLERQGRRADPGGVRHHDGAEVVQHRQRAAAQGQRRVPRRDGSRGDQYVTLEVMLPAKPDAELERLISQWQSGRNDSAHPTKEG